ncbi:MAG: response regulator transcription factor [Deltaproteobacteria bacterium]|nr:response regulator transcription factor [Deltaproteobacteria bacterium]
MVEVRRARVALVDDHPLFRQGLAVALRREDDLEVVGDVGSAAEALELASQVAIDIAVVDVLMPTTSGISLASELHERQPGCKVLGLSVIDDPGLIADMFRAHACGFASKTQEVSEILDAIRQVLGGLRYLPPRVSRDAVEAELATTPSHPMERLTRREREVFELLIRGNSNDEVATKLFISRRTVETHRQRIMRKLSAHSLAQMQRVAARYGGLEH